MDGWMVVAIVAMMLAFLFFIERNAKATIDRAIQRSTDTEKELISAISRMSIANGESHADVVRSFTGANNHEPQHIPEAEPELDDSIDEKTFPTDDLGATIGPDLSQMYRLAQENSGNQDVTGDEMILAINQEALSLNRG